MALLALHFVYFVVTFSRVLVIDPHNPSHNLNLPKNNSIRNQRMPAEDTGAASSILGRQNVPAWLCFDNTISSQCKLVYIFVHYT